MKFEKIIIPPGWQDSFTKYPNGRTIFEALTSTITSVNEGIEAVNTKVDQGLLAIDAEANTIRSEVDASFLILQNKLEQDIEYLQDDLVADISVLQSQVNAAVDSVADKVTQSQLDAVNAQLAEKVNSVNGVLPDVNGNVEIEAGGAGGAGIDDSVTALDKTWSSSKIDTTKANKVQEDWITPTLLNGWTQDATINVGYYKDTLGIVRLKGKLSNGLLGSSIFVLPTGYRPAKEVAIPIMASSAFAFIEIKANGNVVFSGGNPGANVRIESITFKAEQ